MPGVWPAWPIEGRRWTDGGVYSPANAHLAKGYERVVVLAPVASGGGPLTPAADQGRRLADQGARFAVVTRSAAAKEAIGRNALDPSVRAASARAGSEQAKEHAGEVAEVWGH